MELTFLVVAADRSLQQIAALGGLWIANGHPLELTGASKYPYSR
jgi:hypothetical protein